MAEIVTVTEARLADLEASVRELAQLLKRNGELIEQLLAKVASGDQEKSDAS